MRNEEEVRTMIRGVYKRMRNGEVNMASGVATAITLLWYLDVLPKHANELFESLVQGVILRPMSEEQAVEILEILKSI